MTQQYGTVKVDFLTFTSGQTGSETDITIPVSGLADIAESGIDISGDISARNITATGDLVVSGQATVSGLTVDQNAIVSGNLGVSGTLTTDDFTITGVGTTSGAFNVSGLLTASGLTVLNQATVSGLSVTNLAAVGTLTTTGSTVINGPATLNSGLTVNNADVDINSAATIASGLTVENGGIVVSNNGGLNVDGNVIFQDNLTVSGSASFDDITATGLSTFNEVTVTGNFSVDTVAFASGTEAAPSISFVGDADTGFYNAAVNEVRITTSGNDRLTVDSTGNVGIGTSSPSSVLEVTSDSIESLLMVKAFPVRNGYLDLDADANRRAIIRFNSAGVAQWSIGRGDSDELSDSSFHISTGSSGGNSAKFVITSGGNVGIGTSAPSTKLDVVGTTTITASSTTALFIKDNQVDTNGLKLYSDSAGVSKIDGGYGTLELLTGGNERARIDSSGRLLVGTSSWTGGALAVFAGNSTVATGNGVVHISRGRSAIGMSSGDAIGGLYFSDNSGNTFGEIVSFIDAAPGSGDYPGRLVFSTTADGASSPTERMRIDSSGAVILNPDGGTFLINVRNPSVSPSIVLNRPLIPSTATGTTIAFDTIGISYADNTTASTLIHYRARPVTNFGTGVTVSSQYGFYVDDDLDNATNNYGFYSDIASGTGRWNFYANGTADNYFAGNVGIGTTSPGAKLAVKGNASGTSVQVEGNAIDDYTYLQASNPLGVQFQFVANGNNEALVRGVSNHPLAFYTNNTEKMRINSGGNILMGPGATSTIISSLYTLQAVGTRGAVIKSTGGGGNPTITVWNNENTNDCTLIEFRTNTTDVTRGNITYDSGLGRIQYNETSDYRAKTLNGLLQNASNSVASLSVYEGTMNWATQSMPMMVAHEVQEVAPYCVTGEKDAIDENGEPVYQQLNYSAIVPLLTAALQEALAKIESLESRLAALENS